MGKIKILPEQIANKIAAGEVVERPASVVKELIENALDAQASNIDIEVFDGGKKKIVVTDDGEGMDKEDVQICFKRHGTSKITKAADLAHIQSLGFRGEALASIASVSTIKVRSKTQEANIGNETAITGGKRRNLLPVGMPTGTQVIVEDLFYNVPARKKFLRTTGTEIRHITEIVTSSSLASPEVGISLSHNKSVIFKLPKKQDLKERIQQLLGKTVSQSLVPVFFDHPHLKINGFVSKPQLSRDRGDRQYTFVNQRKVSDKVVAGAVKQAFSTLLPQKTYPIFILFLDIPYEMIDVNVHPRKEEIRFINSSSVYKSVKQAVGSALQKQNLTYQLHDTFNKSQLDKSVQMTQKQILKNSARAEFFKKSTGQYSENRQGFDLLFDKDNFAAIEKESEIVQFHNLYLVTQTKNGILIVDQHAADERFLYEYLLEEYKKEKKRKNVQPLLVPITFDVSFVDAEIIKENMAIFQKLGFDIDVFGQNSFKVNTLPQVLQKLDIASVIIEMVGDLAAERSPKDVDAKTKQAISYLACRSAVKAGDSLNQEKRREILNKLKQTKIEYTCPHGRPVKIEFSIKQLEKMFKRRQ